MFKPTPYRERRVLRALEGAWTRFEAVLDRLSASPADGARPRINFNPFYHLGTLSIVLLLVLLLTGVYLTILYKPGPDRAYASLMAIDATWFGSLMRSMHRYASDGLVVVLLLHALKMLLNDRFWGGRWLAWVSGIVLLVLIVIIGAMGYFLVWDRQAQWLGEYFMNFLSGDTRLTFASPQGISGAFQFFVIILFLHVFLSLLITLGIWIHEMRLQRPRLWAPRWLMITTTLVIAALSLTLPVASEAAADLTHLVTQVRLDWLYLGFLPLSRQFGPFGVWIVSGAIVAVLGALPWLLPGRHQGPALVAEDHCTGCAVCARECPYDALEVVPRVIDDRYESSVRVNNALCTGCGLCVGDCATLGIELPGLRTGQVIEDLRTALRVQSDTPPVVVFTCQRHSTLRTHAAGEPVSATASQAAGEGWPGPVTRMQAGGTPLVVCTVPCAGMTQSRWIRGSLSDGARGVLIVTCSTDDCGFREGPRWLIGRMNRGRNSSLLGEQVRWVELAPGDRGAFQQAISESWAGEPRPALYLPKAISFTAGLVILGVTLAVGLLGIQPASAQTTSQGVVRVVMAHTPEIMAAITQIQGHSQNLPEGVTAEQVMGGARFPVALQVDINGETRGDWTYRPSGLHQEGRTYAYETIWLEPGNYEVIVRMMDDGATWREVFKGSLSVAAQRALVLTYDEELERFTLNQ
ncbi:MAG: hydrogenase iron-sulfur subunit [Anaerolineae bacterium]|nr:hydrogenase iron-sulfur subunit [Anaerolineae bacterium]